MAVVRLTTRLWAEYTRQIRSGARMSAPQRQRWQARVDELVTDHLPLVERIAHAVLRRLTRAGQDGYHSRILLEDLVSLGYIGLLQAARRYDAEDGPFPKYAYRRIRGAMLDGHRRSHYRNMQCESIDQVRDRGHEHELERPRYEPVDQAAPPDEWLHARRMDETARRAIAELGEPERTVVLMALDGQRVTLRRGQRAVFSAACERLREVMRRAA